MNNIDVNGDAKKLLQRAIDAFLDDYFNKNLKKDRDLDREEKLIALIAAAKTAFGQSLPAIKLNYVGSYDSPGYTAHYYTIAYTVYGDIFFWDYTHEIY